MKTIAPNNLLKKSWVVTLINLVSRVSGFAREMLKAHYLGATGLADAFQLAFTLPNLFRRLTAEGVMLSSFLPIFGELNQNNGQQAAKQFFTVLFWWLFGCLIVMNVVFFAFADFWVGKVFASGFSGLTLSQAIVYSRIMFGYILFISIAALFQGVLNHNQIFWVSAVTPILLNLVIIAFGVVGHLLGYNIATAFSWGVLTGGILQAVVQLPFLWKFGYKIWHFNKAYTQTAHPYLKKMLRLGVPGIIGAGIYQIDIVISNIIASGLQAGSIAALNFSNRLLELALGVFVVSQTTVLLPQLVQQIQKKQPQQAAANLTDALGIISFFSLPLMLGMMLNGQAIIQLLFQRGNFDAYAVQLTHQALILHLPGLIAIGWNRALTTAYQANQLFFVSMKFAFVTMLINAVSAYGFSRLYSNGGIALANSLSQYALLLLLLIFLRNKTGLQIHWVGFIKNHLLKHVIAVSCMVIAILVLDRWVDQKTHLFLLAKIFVSATIYLIVALLIHTPEIGLLQQVFFRKKTR